MNHTLVYKSGIYLGDGADSEKARKHWSQGCLRRVRLRAPRASFRFVGKAGAVLPRCLLFNRHPVRGEEGEPEDRSDAADEREKRQFLEIRPKKGSRRAGRTQAEEDAGRGCEDQEAEPLPWEGPTRQLFCHQGPPGWT